MKKPGLFQTLAMCIVILLPLRARAAPSRYATRVLADAPIGYWRFGEAPGAPRARDESPNRNDGTYSGGITLGQPGFHDGDTAALFDGRTGRTVVPNGASLNPQFISMEAKISWNGPNDFQQRTWRSQRGKGESRRNMA